MEEENDLNLVEDRFDDLAIDDEPLDLGSEAGSYFDEEEMRSRNEEEEELPTSEEFVISKRYRPSRQVGGQMPTINEEHDLTKATKHDSKGSIEEKNSSMPGETSHDFSCEFKDGKVAIDDYEQMYFSKENRADMLFQEDDMRFRQNKFVKENSWEPSIIDVEPQPSPEIAKSTANILTDNKILPNANSPNENSIFTNSPIANSTQTNVETKTSTPKRPESARFGQRLKPPQLEISAISSIHASSPNRAPTFVKNSPSSSSMMSNVTLHNSDVLNIVKQHYNADDDLMAALENARKGRGRDTMKEKTNFRREAMIPKQPSIPEAFEEPSREVSRLSTARSSTSNTSTRGPQSNLCEREPDLQTVFRTESLRSQRTISRASIVSTTSSNGSERKNLLKINRRRLAFGAVEIGDQLSLELEMENVSDRMFQVRSTIDSNTKAFEIVDNRLALIEPGQRAKVRVVFKPENAGRYQVCLEIDVQSPGLHYVIPLWGCGGLASIHPIIEGELENSSASKDYILRTSKFSKISLRLKNDGYRDGFARIDVYDAWMKPVKCRVSPSNVIMLRRKRECQLEVKLPSGTSFVAANESTATSTSRASSVMSSVSTNSRRNTLSGADYVIEIKWGEELLRQRLKLLEEESRQKIMIDGHNYSSIKFENEEPLKPTKGFPKIVSEDRALFEASLRTTNIMVFSTRSSRQMDSYRSSSSNSNALNSEASILETSAFRYQTFVRDQDATIMPRK